MKKIKTIHNLAKDIAQVFKEEGAIPKFISYPILFIYFGIKI